MVVTAPTPGWSCWAPAAVRAPQAPGPSGGFVDFAARGVGVLADHLGLAIAFLKDTYI